MLPLSIAAESEDHRFSHCERTAQSIGACFPSKPAPRLSRMARSAVPAFGPPTSVELPQRTGYRLRAGAETGGTGAIGPADLFIGCFDFGKLAGVLLITLQANGADMNFTIRAMSSCARIGASRASKRMKSSRGFVVKRALIAGLCLISFWSVAASASTKPSATLTMDEQHRMADLHRRLCADKELSCDYVDQVLSDSRLTIYTPPAPAPPPSGPVAKENQRNPYLTKRFGLLTPESLERCREF